MNTTKLTRFLKVTANDLGFLDCRIAKVSLLLDEEKKLEQWLKKGYHGSMAYMERNFEIRLNPELLVPNAKSIITLAYNYFPSKQYPNASYKISKYAQGKDYHKIIKKKLKHLLRSVKGKVGDFNGRAFVDSAPILERAWAERNGMGWVGKNSLILKKGIGSYFFLAHLVVEIELEIDNPTPNHCGSCTRCIDACPTNAIVEPYIVDSNKCISYLTIELKDQIPSYLNTFQWIFGCDICQDVCPWNKFSVLHNEPLFDSAEEFKKMGNHDFEEITEDIFLKVFDGSPVKRAGFQKLKNTIQHVKKKMTD